jgi:hypothetical protein
MAIRIMLGGVDVTGYRHADSSLTWDDQLNGRGTLSVTFFDTVGGFRPVDGRELLVVTDDTSDIRTAYPDGPWSTVLTADGAQMMSGPERLFGGLLVEPSEREEPGSNTLFFECSAVEFSAICDRRIVTRIYEQQTLDAIILDIVARDLEGEGIATDGVEAGPLIEKAVFPDVTVTDAFNELAELTGYSWRIDSNKVLQFRSRATSFATLLLDGDTLLAGSVRVNRDRQRYRNTQIVRAGTDLTDPRTETLIGDGLRRVFATAFPLGGVPTVEVCRVDDMFVEQSVGILGVEEGKDWYWNLGQAQISQDDAGTILAAPPGGDPTTGDQVRVTYRGLFPVKIFYDDRGEIAARKAVEGGSGVYVNVEDRPQLNSAQSALDTAIALIGRYGQIGTVVEGRTRAAIFAPGQVATVNLPRHGIVNEEMLIESVGAEVVPSDPPEVWYSVRAMSGDPWGGWQEYFRGLLTKNKSFVIGREGEMLVLTRGTDEGVECSDAISLLTMGPESRIGIMAVGTGEVAA